MRLPRFLAVLVAACTCCALNTLANAAQIWTVHHGHTILTLNPEVLAEHGLSIQPGERASESSSHTQINLQVSANEEPIIVDSVKADSVPSMIVAGALHHGDGLVIRRGNSQYVINDWTIDLFDTASSQKSELELQSPSIVFDRASSSVAVESNEVAISKELAVALGDSSLANLVIGSVVTQGELSNTSFDQPASAQIEPVGGGGSTLTACMGSTGPDVIVGDVVVDASGNYSAVGGIDAFAWGTTSCNMGTSNLNWQSGNPNHPVIPQNMYRMKPVNGSVRFEQIGEGWMKHAFTALTQNLCCSCNGMGGSVLGVGCSDPYTSGRNGTQCTTTGGLGPRFQVNAHTGGFIFPYMFRNNCTYIPHTAVTRRCQVLTSDIDATQPVGTTYYAEAQYVTPDDASNLNQNNNCSYKRITISGGTASSAESTHREDPAIHAWKVSDATVTETIVNTPENSGPNPTGRCILSAKATALGGGVYHYEFALYNMNSDRSISSFSIPVRAGANVTNIGFHDVFYHDGDGFNSTTTTPITFDGTDWPGSYNGSSVSWALVPAGTPENSNALRWGTLYNFRFDVNIAPVSGSATLGLFKAVAGQPNSIAAATVVPDPTVPCQDPQLKPIAGQYGSCSLPFTYNVLLTAGTPPFNWSLNNGPAGMTIDSNGQISWPSPVNSVDAYEFDVVVASTCGVGTDTEPMAVRVTLGDFNADGAVNELDGDILASQLVDITPVTPCNADLNNDGFVDGLDIDAFLALMGL